ETIPANEQAPSRVAEIVQKKKVDHVVAGLPKRMDGQIGSAATEVLQFVEKLRAILPCPVVTWDERLTTVAAHRALRDAGKKTRQTRGYVDQVAAQMILQSYLDRRATEGKCDQCTVSRGRILLFHDHKSAITIARSPCPED